MAIAFLSAKRSKDPNRQVGVDTNLIYSEKTYHCIDDLLKPSLHETFHRWKPKSHLTDCASRCSYLGWGMHCKPGPRYSWYENLVKKCSLFSSTHTCL